LFVFLEKETENERKKETKKRKKEMADSRRSFSINGFARVFLEKARDGANLTANGNVFCYFNTELSGGRGGVN